LNAFEAMFALEFVDRYVLCYLRGIGGADLVRTCVDCLAIKNVMRSYIFPEPPTSISLPV
jgi:hypothetical protein